MRIESVRLEPAADSDGVVELAAVLDGFRLWYRFPESFAPAVPGDVFLAAGLLIAMHDRTPLEIDSPCSTQLLESARGPLQDIFSAWYPQLGRVSIEASIAEPHAGRAGVASFFSGGVDGAYTFLRHQAEITHLVTVHGIDVQIDNDTLWRSALRANQEFADEMGKVLVPVQTNIRRWCHPRGVGWSRFHGAGLASIAHALGFHRCYVAATHTYSELFPWGSHPLTDPLWSSDSVALVHDGGEASRSDKLRMIGEHPEALRRLRVCWMDAGYNCGNCEKCLRTRVGLRALGLESSTLPPLANVAPIRKLTIWDDNELSFFEDNLRLAAGAADRDLAAALRNCIRRYRIRKAFSELDEHLLGGSAKRLKKLFRSK